MTRWADVLWARIADPNNLTAISTAIIAAFTTVLATVTTRQVRLARTEFLAARRPKIIIHSVEITYDKTPDSEEETVGASIIYFNIGDTPARIKEINAKISRRPLPLQSGLGIGVQLARCQCPRNRSSAVAQITLGVSLSTRSKANASPRKSPRIEGTVAR